MKDIIGYKGKYRYIPNTYGLCTYNFQMCITLEQFIQNTSNSVLTPETWEIISLENVSIPQEIN